MKQGDKRDKEAEVSFVGGKSKRKTTGDMSRTVDYVLLPTLGNKRFSRAGRMINPQKITRPNKAIDGQKDRRWRAPTVHETLPNIRDSIKSVTGREEGIGKVGKRVISGPNR